MIPPRVLPASAHKSTTSIRLHSRLPAPAGTQCRQRIGIRYKGKHHKALAAIKTALARISASVHFFIRNGMKLRITKADLPLSRVWCLWQRPKCRASGRKSGNKTKQILRRMDNRAGDKNGAQSLHAPQFKYAAALAFAGMRGRSGQQFRLQPENQNGRRGKRRKHPEYLHMADMIYRESRDHRPDTIGERPTHTEQGKVSSAFSRTGYRRYWPPAES